MKLHLSIILLIICAVSGFAQNKQKPPVDEFVEIVIHEGNNVTSELLPMPVGMSKNLTDAKFGAYYFGPKSENDISFILILKGTKFRYSTDNTFTVKFLINGNALNENKNRLITSVDKKPTEEILNFHVTNEELAWMATAKTLSIEIFNADTEKKYDTITFTPTGMKHFKRFSESVLLIKSKLQ